MPQITPNVKHKRNFFLKSRQTPFLHTERANFPGNRRKIQAPQTNIFNESTENRVETYETPGVE
ncbi:Hypothetical protein PYTT_0770 [Akkermansia glycaniphila]|uniref:Uncharacterized protein n=1 Tax=Akkermansia glycaniphila TaxID=1679444 RepID=A0A1H6KZL8_9BACT|nr:Hypothetical protein PYTT_0770 [Akkermansia glycaniphila]